MPTTPTAIRDRAVTDLDLLKAHMRINLSNTTHDTILTFYLDSCKEAADYYCQNPFIVGGVEQAIPKQVELWLLQQSAALFSNPEGNVNSVKLDESMNTDYIINDYDLNFKLLKPFRLEVGFGLY